MFDVSKKRKLQADQFGLPFPKHKCWDNHSSPKTLPMLEENQEAEDLIANEVKESDARHAMEDVSDLESAEDSNSFVGDCDSAMSVYGEGEVKFETEVSKLGPSNGPSSSLLNWGQSNCKDVQCSLNSATATSTGGAGKDEPAFVAGEHDLYHYELRQDLDEPIVEFGSHFDYACSQDGIDSIEPCIDKELDDILNSNGVNPNVYVLSSGRWSVNQATDIVNADAQRGTRKPTIDQEFEQYFSMLML
ncbi:hypothetical protein GH714_014386 [Hevea brasiliensis]|uniref:Uncharacterized protein n=1 Tax=Hevea brasiliensis TaxID=3981 RepID=A0A6A6LP15_HEVBR|nr:hypothetical protein GH714_014386 [Hevea brasiliensis]